MERMRNFGLHSRPIFIPAGSGLQNESEASVLNWELQREGRCDGRPLDNMINPVPNSISSCSPEMVESLLTLFPIRISHTHFKGIDDKARAPNIASGTLCDIGPCGSGHVPEEKGTRKKGTHRWIAVAKSVFSFTVALSTLNKAIRVENIFSSFSRA